MSRFNRTSDESIDPISFQVKRLSALKSYPQNDAELLRIAREYSPSVEVLARAVTEILDSESYCPKPAELRSVLYTKRPPSEHRCDICEGVGWISETFLITKTRNPQNGHITTLKEIITADQARELRLKVGTSTLAMQFVAEGSRMCSCHPGSNSPA